MRLAVLSCLLFIHVSSSYAFTFTAPDGFNSSKKKEVLSVQKCNELANRVRDMVAADEDDFTPLPEGTVFENALRPQCLEKSDPYLFHYTAYQVKMATNAVRSYNTYFNELRNLGIDNIIQHTINLRNYMNTPNYNYNRAVKGYYQLQHQVSIFERSLMDLSSHMRIAESLLNRIFELREKLGDRIDSYQGNNAKANDLKQLIGMFQYVQRAEHYAEKENLSARFNKVVNTMNRLNQDLAEYKARLQL